MTCKTHTDHLENGKFNYYFNTETHELSIPQLPRVQRLLTIPRLSISLLLIPLFWMSVGDTVVNAATSQPEGGRLLPGPSVSAGFLRLPPTLQTPECEVNPEAIILEFFMSKELG